MRLAKLDRQAAFIVAMVGLAAVPFAQAAGGGGVVGGGGSGVLVGGGGAHMSGGGGGFTAAGSGVGAGGVGGDAGGASGSRSVDVRAESGLSATSGSASPSGGTNNDGRASWRHRGRDANAYDTPVLPYGYGNDYIVAGSDGYYNGYYGYAAGYPYGNWNEGAVTTGAPNNGGGTDVPNNSPSTPSGPVSNPPTDNAPSAVSVSAQIENSLENSPEIVAADALVGRDQQAYDAERRRVIDSLRNDPQYQEALKRRGVAQSHVANIDAHDAVPDPAAVAPVAQAKLEAADDLTRLKEQAIANDPAAAAAKAKLNADLQKRDETRQQLLAKYQPAAVR